MALEQDQKGLLVEITDRYLPPYWLYLEVSAHATWRDLDLFLRDRWLECCGHASSFTHRGVEYVADPDNSLAWGDDPVQPMSGDPVWTVRPGNTFLYTYDFGTSTELVGRSLRFVPAASDAPRLRLLARNDTPDFRCAGCMQPATQVCGLCYQEGNPPCWYCDECKGQHRCADPSTDYFLPALNSPRVGLCAYRGGTQNHPLDPAR